jgi:hypothetical protein
VCVYFMPPGSLTPTVEALAARPPGSHPGEPFTAICTLPEMAAGTSSEQ